jgi:hypothetical protein
MEKRFAADREDYDRSLKRAKICSYCHFRGKRREVDGVVMEGSVTRWYCEGCCVYLCNNSYGVSATGDALRSCFDLWHTGDMSVLMIIVISARPVVEHMLQLSP